MNQLLNKLSKWLLVFFLVIQMIPGVPVHGEENVPKTEDETLDAASEDVFLAENSWMMQYDDHIDITDKTVEILDAGTPVSFQVGYGVQEGTLDTAVVTVEGNHLVATGVGTAKVSIDGVVYEVTVEAAPISLILLAGQSNMQGNDGNANQSIVCPDGMVYATYGDAYKMTASNASNYAPSALTGQYRTVNVNGTTDGLSTYPVTSLNEEGAGKMGADSGFAYEWVKQTGEKVWVVNTAHGGSSINTWQKTGANYLETLGLLGACIDTLEKEIAAGHFTLSHMGYYWCQGCADEVQTAQWYVEKYLIMHGNLKTDFTVDHDHDDATEERTFEFGGIIPIRSGHQGAGSYRAGAYTDTTTASYFTSFYDLRMNGPRVAQYWMGNNPELRDIVNVCTIQEKWATMPDGTDGVEAYFKSAYPDGKVDYPVQKAQSASWYTPKTPTDVHDNIHYNQIGYNEIGRESVRNTMVYLGINEPDTTTASVEFVSWDGFTPVTEMTSSTVGSSSTLAVPMVSPVYLSKEFTYTLSDGLTYDYYDVLTDSIFTEGTVFSLGKSISVTSRDLTSYRWSYDGTSFANDVSCGDSANSLTKAGGSISNGLFSSARYQSAQPMVLLHNEPWVVEWSMNATSNTAAMIFSSASTSNSGQPYLYVRGTNSFVGLGYYHGTTYYHVGYYMNDFDIDMTQTHVYRLVNRVEDNTNMVYLFVDGVEIGPMNQRYQGSTTYLGESDWITGMDFSFAFMGTSEHPMNEMIMDYVVVKETGASEDVHFHVYSNWTETKAPSKEGPGLETRTCECGDVHTREVDGIWQTHDLASHLSELPESYCVNTNLWLTSTHDEYYLTNTGIWGIHDSKTVYSITIPVNEGDHIYATSFGKAGTNGHASSNGIRMTWLNDYRLVKTMDPQETYAEFSTNGGYLVVPEGVKYANIPMWNDSDTNEVYILNAEHDYEGITCAVCGETHPEAADYAGKIISIYGDSISTFAGYIPVADGFNLEHLARYPQDDLLTDVNETWWLQVIDTLDAKLGINDSWRGATVSGAHPVTTGTTGENASFANLTRVQNLGSNGTPDVILFYGGTNDLAHVSKVGTFDAASALSQVDLKTKKWDNLADGYVHTLLRLKHYYPEAVILAMLPTYTASYYTDAKLAQANEVLKEICEHYDVPWVDLRESGLRTSMLPDGIHPDAEGMDHITEAVLAELMNQNVESGEHVVYSVTHHLNHVTASHSYLKGVSAGKSFSETLTSDHEMKVTVLMNGTDVTDSVYQNGKITIAEVTGNLVITAESEFSLGTHLKELPEELCEGINLWEILEHDDEYYSADGWTVHSSNKVTSITFAVEEGMKIFASSFEAAGTNGGTVNGIRVTYFTEEGLLKSMSADEVYAEFSENGVLTVPANATHISIPMWTISDEWEVYVLSAEHTYEGIACTVCGETHPESKDYEGKVISILSASTSTFAGYIPVANGFNLEHRSRYPQDNLLTDVNETWWMQVLQELDAKLGINDSWAGSQVLNTQDTNSGDLGPDAAMASLTRIQNLGANGTPDMILFYGGGNDMGRGVTAGTFDPAKAPTEVDLTTTKWTNFADAYTAAIMRLQYFYPDTQIVVITSFEMPSYITASKLNKYGPIIKAICDHYGVETIDLRDCGIEFTDLPDGIHPNAKGMDYITDAVLEALTQKVDMTAGEHTVYTVQHNLTNAKASLGYYKGISANKSFNETLTGDNLNVTVTMGGTDVTSSVYRDGKISVEKVTGNLVITATGKFNVDGHLQQLPEKMCAGVNLWKALVPENIYYTVNGWGYEPVLPEVHSVTFPVTPGDRIWASSFGITTENGYTSAGTRVTWFGRDGGLKTVSKAEVYAEFQENGYLVVPQDAFALNVPMLSADDKWEIYNLSVDHDYQNGKCSACGKLMPDNHAFSGKVISILGESISTFSGYIPVADGFNLNHRSRYPQSNLLTDVNETWWMQLITQLDAKLGINDSWAGSQVLNTIDGNSGDIGEKASQASMTRIQNLGSNGTPDIILFYGAGNDMRMNVPLGTFDPASAPTEVDLTTTKWNTFAEAYVDGIMRLQYFYPDTEIVVMLHQNIPAIFTNETRERFSNMIYAICQHYGVTVIDMADCGITEEMTPDGSHPNAEGMDLITECAVTQLMEVVNMVPGENVVYPIVQNLTNATASLSYYKGVSHGRSFNEKISGDGELEVTVMMGGKDITDMYYAEGMITIPEVTGELIITVNGDCGFDSHVQQLPEKMCAGVNLWQELTPENIYYTVNGWGNVSGNTSYSITFPVTEGDQIWATSFGKYPENGSNANGTRITWFDENGLLKTVDRTTVYNEFIKNGYVTAPEGAVAVNVPMSSNNNEFEVYVLNAGHDDESVVTEPTCTKQGYTTYTCSVCGDSYVDDYVNATGIHTYDDGVCTVCGNSKLASDWFVPDFAEGDYSMVVLPDTQIIVESYPETYYKLAQWIADNKDTYQIEAVLHMGDMVNTNTSAQWEVCKVGMDIIDASGVAWMPMRGNHDDSTWFNNTFDYETYGSNKSWFGGSYDSNKLDHTYWFVSANEREYLILSLGYAPSTDVLSWAEEVVKENSDKNVILTAHQYMNKDGSLIKPQGTDIWNRFKKYENVVLAASGHVSSPDIIEFVDTNAANEKVTSLLVDNQNMDASNNLGMLLMLTFHDDSDVVEANWYSVRYDAFYQPDNQFALTVPHVDDELTSVEKDITDQFSQWTTGGPVIASTGKTFNDDPASGKNPNLKYSDFVSVEDYDMLKLTICARQGYSATGGFAFYEEKDVNTFISYASSTRYGSGADAEGTEVRQIAVPENAKYIRVSYWSDASSYSSVPFSCTGIKMVKECDHDYQSVVTKPTCTEAGLTTHTCSKCNDSYVDTPTDALGHDFKEVVVDPACTEYGVTNLICTVCDHSEIKQETVEITDQFVWTDQSMIYATTGKQAPFSVWMSSDYVDISAYSSLKILTANTATVDSTIGLAFYDKDKNYVSGLIHTDKSGIFGVLVREIEVPENAVYIRSTWYSPSHPNYESSFGDFYCFATKDEIIGALGHDEVIDKAIEATCTETGLTEGKHCERCDEILVAQTVTEKLGHDYQSVVTEPTCTDDGYTTYTCTRGDHTYVADHVEALGHDEVIDKAVDATCTETGLTEGKHCERCDEILVAQTVTEKLGHDYQSVVTQPTCTEDGYTTHTCTRCDKTYTDAETEKLGHVLYVLPYSVQGKHVVKCERCDEEVEESCTYGEGVVVQNATMMQDGIVEKTCSKCSDVLREFVAYTPALEEGVIRLSGKTRYETSFEIAKRMKMNLQIERFDAVVLASGAEFADALAGSILAVKKSAPILLVNSKRSNLTDLQNFFNEHLSPEGTVYVLGGTAAVPQWVEELPYSVVRLSGRTRYETNLKILEEAEIKDEPLLVCTGTNYADSLSASASKLPILLVSKQLTDTQKQFLSQRSGPIYILGGRAAVNEEIEAELKTYGEVERISGKTRFETSVLFAKKFFDHPEHAVLSYAKNYPDGLCGGPLAASMNAPVILVTSEEIPSALEYMQMHQIHRGAVLGGSILISNDSTRTLFGLSENEPIK